MSELDIFTILKERVKEFPVTPGVYLMKGINDKIIYVGKAKNLKSRLKSYFGTQTDMTPKTKILVKSILEIEYVLTKTEVEAFLLEASLIKKHRPKYNIRLKDDKTYPYIRLTWKDEYPRLYVSRKVVRDGSLYFGPYTSGYAVQGTIRFLNRTFKIRDCTDAVFKSRKRPCLTYQIGRCTAPCVDLIEKNDYRDDLEGAKDFLKGKDKKLLKELKTRMEKFAEEEKFEVALRLRDSISAIKSVMQKQIVINAQSSADQDVVAFLGSVEGTLIETLHVRGGRVLGSRGHFFPDLNAQAATEDPREWLVSFLNQYYEDNIIPEEIILPVDIGQDLTNLFKDVLRERSSQEVSIRLASDHKAQELLAMAQANCDAHYASQIEKSLEKKKGLQEIQDRLGLKAWPRRIECYDISHFQGDETVASQVVFEEGLPAKEHYRRYKIKTVAGVDDFASLQEVLTRRLKHTEYEAPDLLLIDGGKGQLSATVKILEDLSMTHLPIVSLAKARAQGDFTTAEVAATEERFYIPGRANPVTFKPGSSAFQILVGLRDEAHRFALNYHRKLRGETSLESELDYVVGLGPLRKKELLKRFKSIEEIKSADAEEIAKIKGFNRVLAERILLQLEEGEASSGESENEA
jgi:excinuclease ABC subunit C